LDDQCSVIAAGENDMYRFDIAADSDTPDGDTWTVLGLTEMEFRSEGAQPEVFVRDAPALESIKSCPFEAVVVAAPDLRALVIESISTLISEFQSYRSVFVLLVEPELCTAPDAVLAGSAVTPFGTPENPALKQ
jgi:hypothetical protein